MKIAVVFICLTVFVGLSCRSADMPTNQWSTFVLWSNRVVSASLRYMPQASLADEDYMFVEFDNHTDKPLDVDQAWIVLPGTWTEKQTQESSFMGDMASGVIYTGKLPPGKTRAGQYDSVFEAGLKTLGLPPKQGFHVEIAPKANLWLKDGTKFSTSDADRKFSFEFRYPNSAELVSMKFRFKELLTHTHNESASVSYLFALSQIPEVRDSISRDELLVVLKSLSWLDGKGAIMPIIGRRFLNDPDMLSYFVDELSRDRGESLFCFPPEIWQNPIFVEPLVRRYEKNGSNSVELQQVRPVWITNQPIVARLSTALLKRHPVLNSNVTELAGTDLCDWCSIVSDAGIIGDRKFLKLLEPVLDDKRIVPDCISEADSRPRPSWNPRVCDCALEAILMILDGDSWAAFEKAGITGWSTKEENYAAHDQIISDLKKRLNLMKDRHAK